MKKLSLVGLMFLVSANVYGARGYWEDNSSLPATWTNGYVGIGTEYPSYLLDVDGTARVKGFRLTTGAHSGYVLTCGSGGVGTWQAPSGGGSCLWSVGYGGIYYNGGSVGIFNLGGSNDVSVLAISENTSTLDEFIFKGDFSGTGETGNALKLETHWADNVMTWRGDGNVGIGTSSPGEKLVVNGNLQMKGSNRKIFAGGSGPLIIEGYTSGYPFGATLKLDQASHAYLYGGYGGGSVHHVILAHTGSQEWGNVGIGTDDPDYKLDVAGTVNMSGFKLATGAASGYVLTSNSSGVGTWQPAGGGLWSGDASTVYYNGNVGIGTSDPGDYKLAVNGTIRAKEIKVETDWSDFVFADNYKLMPLDKLENHIKVNKSLPGIPTEKEVLEGGVNLGEMQAKLLEKVEELTLYVIELKKENEELRNRISALEK